MDNPGNEVKLGGFPPVTGVIVGLAMFGILGLLALILVISGKREFQ